VKLPVRLMQKHAKLTVAFLHPS